MAFELAAYGFFSGLLYHLLPKKTANIYLSLVGAMILGRVVSGLAKSLIFNPGVAPFAWVTTTLVTGIPGIIIQLVVMPLLVIALTRARLLPQRYPEKTCHA